MGQAHNTAPVAATYTFAHSSSRNFSELHTLYARDDKNKGVDMITVITSIAGVLVSIIGLILGHILEAWSPGPRGLRHHHLTALHPKVQKISLALSPLAHQPFTHSLLQSISTYLYPLTTGAVHVWLATATQLAVCRSHVNRGGNRISIHPAEPEPGHVSQMYDAAVQLDDKEPKAETAKAA